MLKKILLMAFMSIYLLGNDFWQVGFQQGYSSYNIENSKKDKLFFECDYKGGSIVLYNKGKDVYLNENEYVNFMINDEKKFVTKHRVPGSMNDDMAWENLLYSITEANKIIVEANNQKFVFEPSNLKEIEGLIKSCTEYETSEVDSTTNNNDNNTTSTPEKLPFKFDLKEEYSQRHRSNYPLLIVTSLNDKLIIKNIKVNKEKCEITPILETKQTINAIVLRNFVRGSFPISIPEFEALKVTISHGCNVLRLDIETNLGSWSFGEN